MKTIGKIRCSIDNLKTEPNLVEVTKTLHPQVQRSKD